MILNIFFICLLACSLLFPAMGCGLQTEENRPAEQIITTSRLLLHTVVTVQAEGIEAENAVAEAMARVAELEALTDPNRAESDIARLNAVAGQKAVHVSEPVFHLLEQAQLLAQLTDGGFDTTLLPVSRLYGFGTDQPCVPDAPTLQEALTHTGWQKLVLNQEAGTAYLTDSEAAVDLGAAVKGMAADEVRRIFREHGIKRGLCSFGHSTVLAMGGKTEEQPWRIGLQHPRQGGETLGVVTLEDQILSVSGDYERYFMYEGERYHHLLNSANGLPAQGIQSAAVIIEADAPDAGLWSDMLSTAFFVLGKEKTGRLVESLPVKVQYMLTDAVGQSWSSF